MLEFSWTVLSILSVYLSPSHFLEDCRKWNTHAHPFNGPLSGTTWVSRYQKGKTNLDFTEARDSEWQWNPLDHMQICTSLQTTTPVPHRSVFLQAGCPSCHPTNSIKALKAIVPSGTATGNARAPTVRGLCMIVSVHVCAGNARSQPVDQPANEEPASEEGISLIVTSSCSAFYVRWQRGTARICPLLLRSNCCAAVDLYLLFAGPTASELQQRVCCCGHMLGQTDGDCCTFCARSANNHHKSRDVNRTSTV